MICFVKMICFVIIIDGLYFSTKYRLYYESYQLLHDIENEFGIATLGIKALEIKYNNMLPRYARQNLATSRYIN